MFEVILTRLYTRTAMYFAFCLRLYINSVLWSCTNLTQTGAGLSLIMLVYKETFAHVQETFIYRALNPISSFWFDSVTFASMLHYRCKTHV